MKALKRLLGKGRPSPCPAIPPGHRLYAVGDVHGRDDLLASLVARIAADHRARPPARLVLVFLGDLIDRGPASAGVVERLRAYRPDDARLVYLAGNHEEVMLRVIDGDSSVLGDWLRFGGAECLQSYGLDPGRIRRMGARRGVEAIRAAVPPAHVDFLRRFEDTFRAGDYLFVHAGIRPGIPLAEQSRSDLRWIRQPFLSDLADHGFVVVHGHTVREEVEERANRIGIDTGAYRTGVLTALGLEGEERWFIQARNDMETERLGPVESAIPSEVDGVSSQSG